MSVAGVTSPPVTCSGAMYSGVPRTPASPVSLSSPPPAAESAQATPKSVMATRVVSVEGSPGASALGTSMTLLLLKSRWTTPSACAAASPAHI